jgi:hypothetical protein
MIRKGDWLQTYTGKKFWPLDPSPDDVCICDIANALAKLPRFNVTVPFSYSVASHCLSMATAAYTCQYSPALQLWALLHDAAEAYLGDIPRPVKNCIPQIREVEEKVLRAVAWRFNMEWPMPEKIKELDDVLLAMEARQFLPVTWLDDWNLVDLSVPLDLTAAMHGDVFETFLEEFERLSGQKAECP